MPASIKNNAWRLQPPPGAVFQQTLGMGGVPELEIVFERGREAEVLAWFGGWLAYLESQQGWIDPRIRNAVIAARGAGDPNTNLSAIRTLAPKGADQGAEQAAPVGVTQAPERPAPPATTHEPATVCTVCEQPFNAHEKIAPYPHLRAGCGAFKS